MNDFDFSRTFFYSRAVDYDEEEEEALKDLVCSSTAQSVPPVPAVSRSSNCISCSLLLVAIGPPATGFVKSHVLDEHSSEVGEISSDMLKSPSGHACKLCRLKNLPNVVVVTCDMDIKSEETFLWTQQLFACVDVECSPSGQVVVLTSASVADYISALPPGDMPECFLRSLATRTYPDLPVAPVLVQPNLVTGLPAQVMTYCEVHSVAAVLYVCYVRTSCLDSLSLTAFQSLHKSASLADVIAMNERSKRRAAELSSKFSSANYNSLYL